jgi:glycosyltransferase involved in cell wall biosynthesis
MNPRVLFVARDTFRLPLVPSLARKWDALSEVIELRVLAAGSGSDPRFALRSPTALDGPRFYASLPVRIAHELKSFRPDVVVAQSPFEAFAAEIARGSARSSAKIVLEVHGDWHGSTRLYGSRARAAIAPAGDRVAGFAIRHADAHRAVSGFTASLLRGEGREPLAVFTTFSDHEAFSGPRTPVPDEPRAIFVGVLERYKNVHVLADAWRAIATRIPEGRLHLVGTGSQASVAAGLEGDGAEWDRRLEPPALAAALDRARVLVLPSVSEGLPRVAIEAFLRGRAVIGSRAGGIPDIVQDGANGLLVTPGHAGELAVALERVLTDHDLAVRLGAGAAESSADWASSPQQYAARVRALVETVLAS